MLLLVGVLGLVFGSFAAAASWRLPRGESLLSRSACPHCHHVLGPRELVPLLSWLWQKGRCRACGKAISLRYPLLELLTAALFLGCWLSLRDAPLPLGLAAAVGTLLLIILVADLETFIIPDAALLVLTPLALVWRWLQGNELVSPLLSGLVVLGLGLALQWGYRRVRGFDGLGLGDVKFMGVAALFLGPWGMPGFLLAAGILGIVFGLLWRMLGRGAVFPFGPALVVALALGLIWPDWLETLRALGL